MGYSNELTFDNIEVGKMAHFFDEALEKWRHVKIISWSKDSVDTEEIDTDIAITGPFNMFFVD